MWGEHSKLSLRLFYATHPPGSRQVLRSGSSSLELVADLVLVNQFNPSSGGVEVYSFDLDALLMSLEIEKVESELIKLFPDLETEYTAGEVMAALEPYLEDGRIALDDSSCHVKVYNMYLVSYEWVGINW